MTRRLRVLVSAFACNPFRGSEDGVGWGWLRAIATRHDVHVITAAFQRESIERWYAENPDDEVRVTFHYVEPRWFHYRPTRSWRFVESTVLKPLMNLAYAQWLRDAARFAARLDAVHDFDLVHLVTYVGYRFPGRYDRLGKPLVWGPIGGLENTRWRFLPSFGPGGAVYYAGRNVVNALQRRLLPSPKRAFRYADGGVIAATEGNARAIRHFYGVESTVITEIGSSGEAVMEPSFRADGEPLRLVWSGEHLPGKALPFLLKALARVRDGADWHLTVLGAGRCSGRWRRLAARLGMAERVRWTGWVERTAALEFMDRAHLLVITSLKDLTSTVLLEGLSRGLPVICPDHCGFSNVVDATCGLKLPLTTPRRFTHDLAQAVEQLATDEPRRARLAAGALERATHYTWAEKAERIDEVYARVCPPATTQAPEAAGAEAERVVRAW